MIVFWETKVTKKKFYGTKKTKQKNKKINKNSGYQS